MVDFLKLQLFTKFTAVGQGPMSIIETTAMYINVSGTLVKTEGVEGQMDLDSAFACGQIEMIFMQLDQGLGLSHEFCQTVCLFQRMKHPPSEAQHISCSILLLIV
jgi:hypothetical protein